MLIDWWDVVWVVSEVGDWVLPDGRHAQRREATARAVGGVVSNFNGPFNTASIQQAMHDRFPRRRIEPVLRMWLRDGRIERVKGARPRQYRKTAHF
jgi:hypothetical protein